MRLIVHSVVAAFGVAGACVCAPTKSCGADALGNRPNEPELPADESKKERRIRIDVEKIERAIQFNRSVLASPPIQGSVLNAKYWPLELANAATHTNLFSNWSSELKLPNRPNTNLKLRPAMNLSVRTAERAAAEFSLVGETSISRNDTLALIERTGATKVNGKKVSSMIDYAFSALNSDPDIRDTPILEEVMSEVHHAFRFANRIESMSWLDVFSPFGSFETGEFLSDLMGKSGFRSRGEQVDGNLLLPGMIPGDSTFNSPRWGQTGWHARVKIGVGSVREGELQAKIQAVGPKSLNHLRVGIGMEAPTIGPDRDVKAFLILSFPISKE